ncbi:alpha/beta hydrolase [Amycolatopsis viridis]|uniref:Acetyl esterase n=1 Tax=Amycolatopsis viridis TaxID=185678 RepID=A0ABX0SWH5_9PSEU|nr:alpha/beta hydrolase [Amycolatopsis viridis]NIH81316.1 acetyl esterase [Amycolatopsis viridis]
MSLREQALGTQPDWLAMTEEELIAYRDAENQRRASPAMRAITGTPHPDADIQWQEIALPGRNLPVRVLRPARTAPGTALPLVLHVHGGGFVGTAVQCDWITSHVAVDLPAVVVSVEHRLLAPDTPLRAAADDGWDALEHVVRKAAEWGVDPARVAVFGESCGGLIGALTTLQAREAGLPLRAQVLVNPVTEVTDTMLAHASIAEHADSPTLTVPQLQLIQRLGVPPGTDARTLSPLYADDLGGLPPALVLVPTQDPLADHARRYAERLDAAGTPVRLAEFPGATHGFLSMPEVVPDAGRARAEITAFLHDALGQD